MSKRETEILDMNSHMPGTLSCRLCRLGVDRVYDTPRICSMPNED